MTGMFGMPRMTEMIRIARMTWIWMASMIGMTGISEMTRVTW